MNYLFCKILSCHFFHAKKVFYKVVWDIIWSDLKGYFMDLLDVVKKAEKSGVMIVVSL